ncbi:hypothetical protein OC842_001301 [Tilletia horrida]|uniref:Mitochondrial inner membrane protease subunit n=1 Tax=Tilletia horrida TaxID=155126 RepID=A0AAN6GGQ1_9BASI|nr:hypothetical protein OC842_001301 [Tilletia horrida]
MASPALASAAASNARLHLARAAVRPAAAQEGSVCDRCLSYSFSQQRRLGVHNDSAAHRSFASSSTATAQLSTRALRPAQGLQLMRVDRVRARWYATSEASSTASSTSAEPPVHNRRWSRLVLGAVLTAPFLIILENHWYSLSHVEGGSMSPTLNPTRESQIDPGKSDHVLLNRWAVAAGELQRGDIVYLHSPVRPDLIICKRILALEGDIVRVRTGTNATRFPSQSDYTRPRARIPGSRSSGAAVEADGLEDKEEDEHSQVQQRAAGGFKLFRIPEGHAWVEGDSSASASTSAEGQGQGWSMGKSRDSRDFGPVSLALVTARVDYIFFPPNRIGPPGKRSDIDFGMRLSPQHSISRDDDADGLPTGAVVLITAQAGQQEDDDDEAAQPRLRVRSAARRRRSRNALVPADAHPDDSPISPYVLDPSPAQRS